MRAALAAAALVALALPAEAQARRDRCAAATDTRQMLECTGAELRAAEARMAQALRTAAAEDDAAGRARLRAAQLAWLSFRDAQCAYEEADSVGGSLHPIALAVCKTRLTDERTRQLRPQAR
jgi:uncharacterized protein YecT (DUF1311 family)